MERFVPLKLYLGHDREPTRRYRPFWTPTFYFLDPEGNALLDWAGLIPAAQLLPFLDLGEALVGLRRGRFKEAVTLLEGVAENHSGSVFAPEALWWLGVVLHVTKGDSEALAATRIRILKEYPGSPAALKV